MTVLSGVAGDDWGDLMPVCSSSDESNDVINDDRFDDVGVDDGDVATDDDADVCGEGDGAFIVASVGSVAAGFFDRSVGACWGGIRPSAALLAHFFRRGSGAPQAAGRATTTGS